MSAAARARAPHRPVVGATAAPRPTPAVTHNPPFVVGATGTARPVPVHEGSAHLRAGGEGATTRACARTSRRGGGDCAARVRGGRRRHPRPSLRPWLSLVSQGRRRSQRPRRSPGQDGTDRAHSCWGCGDGAAAHVRAGGRPIVGAVETAVNVAAVGVTAAADVARCEALGGALLVFSPPRQAHRSATPSAELCLFLPAAPNSL